MPLDFGDDAAATTLPTRDAERHIEQLTAQNHDLRQRQAILHRTIKRRDHDIAVRNIALDELERQVVRWRRAFADIANGAVAIGVPREHVRAILGEHLEDDDLPEGWGR